MRAASITILQFSTGKDEGANLAPVFDLLLPSIRGLLAVRCGSTDGSMIRAHILLWQSKGVVRCRENALSEVPRRSSNTALTASRKPLRQSGGNEMACSTAGAPVGASGKGLVPGTRQYQSQLEDSLGP